jgi:SAM-dependent methyltransferase
VVFVDPADRNEPLTRRGDWLESRTGRCYPIRNGVPRFADTPGEQDEGQAQTADSFGFKWTRDAHWGFAPEHQPIVWGFWREVFGWSGPNDLRAIMSGKTVLDAGCGSGASLNQFVDWPAEVAAVDISSAVDVCQRRFSERPHVAFAQADLMTLPFADESFDIVWSNGVLHHTPSVFRSLEALVRHLKRGGLMIFYIYGKKAPIREFADDHVRRQVSGLPPQAAWKRMEAVTALGRSLSAITEPLVIEEDIPELGIAKGTYNLQRFIYYHVLKCYWNPAMAVDDNVHVNFDWYHPVYAHRHTEEEVRGWLQTLGLDELMLRRSDSGIAVMARRL